MKRIIKTTSLLLFLSWTFTLHSQDIHYTQFNWVPMLLNPAMSGQLPDADMQYGGIYRNQGFTVSPQAYSSFSFFVDSKWIKGFRSRDYLGLGMMLLHDNAGTGALTTDEARINLAYHFPLSEKNTLSLGGQGGFIQRAYGNFSAFSFEEELSGGIFSEALQKDKRQYFDGHLGLMFRSQLDDLSALQVGAAVYHFNHRSAITDLSSIDKFTLRYSSFAKYERELNDRLDFEPRVQFQYTERSRELLAQVMFSYLISEFYNTPTKIKLGGGWRMNDSWQLLLGAEYGNWEVGFAYDSNISGLAKASGLISSLEFGIKYRHKRPEKKEKPKPKIQEIEPIQIDLSLWVEDELDSVRISISEESLIVEDNITSDYPYRRDLGEDKTYHILVEKPGYIPATVSFTTNGIRKDSTIEKIVALKLIPIEEELVETPPEKVVTPPKEEIVVTKPPVTETEEIILYREKPFILNNIHYDFDDDKILKKAEIDLNNLLQLLRTYPNMVIELSSHTDVRGPDEYNVVLSQRRAESARLWLLKKGIEKRRIKAVGYGETQLINRCRQGVRCTDKEHRQNRRTEFKIISGPTSVRYRVN